MYTSVAGLDVAAADGVLRLERARGSAWRSPRGVGEVRAREMRELGRVVSGAEAAEWGMIHRTVDGDALETEVGDVVAKLASSATVALGLTKWLQHAGTQSSLDA